MYTLIENIVIRFGYIIKKIAFISLKISANSACILAYYEPKEPKDLDKYKNFNK